jgi:hypothetical protein
MKIRNANSSSTGNVVAPLAGPRKAAIVDSPTSGPVIAAQPDAAKESANLAGPSTVSVSGLSVPVQKMPFMPPRTIAQVDRTTGAINWNP